MKLIFLTYLNRSGSTFLSYQFSKNPDFIVFPEASVLVYYLLKDPNKEFSTNKRLHKKLINAIKNDKKLKNWNLTEKINLTDFKNSKTNFDFFVKILKCYQKIHNKNSANYGLFKNNSLFLLYKKLNEDIKNRYDIKFISLLRDPRAIFYSQNQTYNLGSKKKMNTNPIITANSWLWFLNESKTLENNRDFFISTYENLIQNFHCEMSLLYDKLKISKKNMNLNEQGDLYDRMPKDQKKIHPNITKQPDSLRIYAWKNNIHKIPLILIEKRIDDTLDRTGYKSLNFGGNKQLIHLSSIYYKLRIILNIDKYYVIGK